MFITVRMLYARWKYSWQSTLLFNRRVYDSMWLQSCCKRTLMDAPPPHTSPSNALTHPSRRSPRPPAPAWIPSSTRSTLTTPFADLIRAFVTLHLSTPPCDTIAQGGERSFTYMHSCINVAIIQCRTLAFYIQICRCFSLFLFVFECVVHMHLWFHYISTCVFYRFRFWYWPFHTARNLLTQPRAELQVESMSNQSNSCQVKGHTGQTWVVQIGGGSSSCGAVLDMVLYAGARGRGAAVMLRCCRRPVLCWFPDFER